MAIGRKLSHISGPLKRYDLPVERDQYRLFCPVCGGTPAMDKVHRPGEYCVIAGGFEPPLPVVTTNYYD